MKKITVTLKGEAEKVFNELMYSLPKNEDGTGMCSQSQAVSYALCRLEFMEKENEELKEQLLEQEQKYLRLAKKHKKDKTPKEGE